jgi:hypothetical protein
MEGRVNLPRASGPIPTGRPETLPRLAEVEPWPMPTTIMELPTRSLPPITRRPGDGDRPDAVAVAGPDPPAPHLEPLRGLGGHDGGDPAHRQGTEQRVYRRRARGDRGLSWGRATGRVEAAIGRSFAPPEQRRGEGGGGLGAGPGGPAGPAPGDDPGAVEPLPRRRASGTYRRDRPLDPPPGHLPDQRLHRRGHDRPVQGERPRSRGELLRRPAAHAPGGLRPAPPSRGSFHSGMVGEPPPSSLSHSATSEMSSSKSLPSIDQLSE